MSKVERELAFAELAELVTEMRTQTQAVARLIAGQVVNDILHSELLVLDAEGIASREFGAAFGSVSVATFGDSVVVAAGASQGAGGAPTKGVAISQVGPGMGRVINMIGHAVTIYGTAGTQITLEVFTKAQPPAFGQVLP